MLLCWKCDFGKHILRVAFKGLADNYQALRAGILSTDLVCRCGITLSLGKRISNEKIALSELNGKGKKRKASSSKP